MRGENFERVRGETDELKIAVTVVQGLTVAFNSECWESPNLARGKGFSDTTEKQDWGVKFFLLVSPLFITPLILGKATLKGPPYTL